MVLLFSLEKKCRFFLSKLCSSKDLNCKPLFCLAVPLYCVFVHIFTVLGTFPIGFVTITI